MNSTNLQTRRQNLQRILNHGSPRQMDDFVASQRRRAIRNWERRLSFEAWCDRHPRSCIFFAIVLVGILPAIAILVFNLRFK